MKRNLRRSVPLAAVAAVAVAGVLLATQAWSGEEAAGGLITYRLCDTVLEGPIAQPGSLTVLVGTRLVPGVEKPTFNLRVLETGGGRSELSIDAETSAVLTERYADPSHRERLQEIMQTVRLEPLDPGTAGWPYTEVSQLSSEPVKSGAFRYREPDPASGIKVGLTRGIGDGFHAHMLRVRNCRSTMEITAVFRTGTQPDEVTVTKDIHPDDEAAFQTFYDEVVITGLEPWP